MVLNQVTLKVTDLERAIDFYSKLGLELIVKSPHYARFIVPGNQATLSLDVTSHKAVSDAIIYFECNNVDSVVADCRAKGLIMTSEPEDKQWLWREAYLSDPDGNTICLYNAGENRLNPPWRINSKSDITV